MTGSDLTVVIPTYKRPKLLARALESVVQQGIAGLTIRVFDNASGDETEAVVREVAKRQPIDYVRRAENIGVTRNLLGAIDSVTTRYCAILNDDDMQLPGLLASAIEHLSTHPSAGAFCSRTLTYNTVAHASMGVQGTGWPAGLYKAGEHTEHMLREHFTPTAVVFAADALKTARFELSDIEMMGRIAEANDFVVSEEILGVYVVHPAAWSSSQSRDAVRNLTLRRLAESLQLRSLTDHQKVDVVLRASAKLLENELKVSLATPGPAADARDLATAAGMLSAIARGQGRIATGLFHAGLSRMLRWSGPPRSERTARAVDRIWRTARSIDRVGNRSNVDGQDEHRVLALVAALDRSAASVYEAVAV